MRECAPGWDGPEHRLCSAAEHGFKPQILGTGSAVRLFTHFKPQVYFA